MKSRTPSSRGRPILAVEEDLQEPLDREVKMGTDNQAPKSTMGAIQRFLNNTTAHGLPRISKARNQMGRGFWVFVWLAFFSVFCYQVIVWNYWDEKKILEQLERNEYRE
ncbi:unnamed protein product [Caenorhabditis nigoni]